MTNFVCFVLSLGRLCLWKRTIDDILLFYYFYTAEMVDFFFFADHRPMHNRRQANIKNLSFPAKKQSKIKI